MGVKLDPNKLHAIIIRTAAENHLPLNYDTFNAICKGYETGYETGYTQACDDAIKMMDEKGLLPQNGDK